MSKRLSENLTSLYLGAAQRLKPKTARKKIVAYVESYDDVFFWRTVLDDFEDDRHYFEIMLPSRSSLGKGKKLVLTNKLGPQLGTYMIACVDADYDYLLQDTTPTSRMINRNPFVFHTYAYAIENYQCYAETLHRVCVMATLNDHAVFDFVDYMERFSEACFPLFVWSVWMYRTGQHNEFSLTEFCRLAEPGGFNVAYPQASIDHLRGKIDRKVRFLQKRYPAGKHECRKLQGELLALGVTPETTYLYIQGHHIFDSVVVPIMTKVCNKLRLERENEISRTSVHSTQRQNEMSCYENSIEGIASMLKKSVGYMNCPQFKRLQGDVARYLDECDGKPATGPASDAGGGGQPM